MRKADAAIVAAGTAGIGVVDATAFTGSQACNSNPFHSTVTNNGNVPVKIKFNANGVDIVTSVPWFTPQAGFQFEGNPSNSAGTGGVIIEACGPLTSANAQWSSGSSTCTPLTSGGTVPQFPGAVTFSSITGDGVHRTGTCSTSCANYSLNQVVIIGGSSVSTDNGFQVLTQASSSTIKWVGTSVLAGGASATVQTGEIFPIAIGPMAAGTYAFVLGEGGQGTTDASGWNSDGTAFDDSGVAVSCGGNGMCFARYTENSDERTLIENTRQGGAMTGTASSGGACTTNANAGTNACSYGAGWFGDRPLATTSQPGHGPSRSVINNLQQAGGGLSSSNTNYYPILFEGQAQVVVFSQGNCNHVPQGWVTGVSSTVASPPNAILSNRD